MKIVGVGVGPGMITPEVAVAIQNAEIIYGSPRAIELAKEYIMCEAKNIKDYSKINELPFNAVVLSTGDPNLSGLGKYAGHDDKIIPGISSLQVACARLKVDMSDIVVVTAHGRDAISSVAKFRQAICSGSTVFLLPSPEMGVETVVSTLKSIGLDVPIAVLEKLGYPDEHVEVGTVKRLPKVNSQLYCILVGPGIEGSIKVF
ncbi:MAG: cobalt-precorrin-7 (C(5))-methyltransferase [Nitrospirae bacterium]|nr:cobalt-precorrin-7 (C(5))-methyltransferase [Nitrospirota bacterium]